jgi:hypothetical protein
MTAKPRKPLLVNLTWAVVLAGLGLPAYVASFGVVCWLDGRDTVDPGTAETLYGTVYRPIVQYGLAGLPGDDSIYVFGEWCYWRGKGASLSWAELSRSGVSWELYDIRSP